MVPIRVEMREKHWFFT